MPSSPLISPNAWPNDNSVRSEKGRAISWQDSGKPLDERPNGSANPGSPK